MQKILKKSDLVSKNWSGGTTTELYISPESSVFGQDSFDFRISIATVEEEKTTYTPFPGIMRNLMVVSGEIKLTIDENDIKLNVGDSLIFSGDDEVLCSGIATNFNVLYQAEKVECKLLMINTFEKVSLAQNTFVLIYPLYGAIEIYEGHRKRNIDSSEIMVSFGRNFDFLAEKDSCAIVCFIEAIS